MRRGKTRGPAWLIWLLRRLGLATSRREPYARYGVSTPMPPPRSASEVFTPTRPGTGYKALVGRSIELARILQAILDEYTHVALYSERGRGKTSLSNLAIEVLCQRSAVIARFACEPDTRFDDLIRGLMRSLPSVLLSEPPSSRFEGCEKALPDRDIRAADLANILDHLTCDLLVFVVDEFDRIADQQTRTRLADTIKMLSDRRIRVHFIIVGVADTLEQLMGDHPSIQRNIMAIHLPLLTNDEIGLMLERGGQEANLNFTDEAKDLVCFVACGMPYMAQLLGLRIAQSALRHGGGVVTRGDLKTAIGRLLNEVPSGILSMYAALCESFEETKSFLHSVANAEQDAQGTFKVSTLGKDVSVGGCRLSSNAWSLLIVYGVFSQPPSHSEVTSISNRPLIYYVQLLSARDNLDGVKQQRALH